MRTLTHFCFQFACFIPSCERSTNLAVFAQWNGECYRVCSLKIDHEVEIVRYFVATSVIESGDVELGASIFSPPSQACFRSSCRRACLSGVDALFVVTAHAGQHAIVASKIHCRHFVRYGSISLRISTSQFELRTNPWNRSECFSGWLQALREPRCLANARGLTTCTCTLLHRDPSELL